MHVLSAVHPGKQREVLVSAFPLLLGLDPSPLRLGWALATLEDGAPIACGCEPLGADPRAIRDALRVVDVRAIQAGEVSLLYVERPWSGRSRLLGIRSAETSGRVLEAAYRRWPGAPTERLEPAEWKHLAGLPGNASKAAVAAHALSLGWRPDGSQDAADAACIALAGVRRNADILDAALAQGGVA